MSPRADAGGVAFARAPRTPSGRAHQPGLKKSVRAASVHARRREAEGELAHRQVHGSDTAPARPLLCQRREATLVSAGPGLLSASQPLLPEAGTWETSGFASCWRETRRGRYRGSLAPGAADCPCRGRASRPLPCRSGDRHLTASSHGLLGLLIRSAVFITSVLAALTECSPRRGGRPSVASLVSQRHGCRVRTLGRMTQRQWGGEEPRPRGREVSGQQLKLRNVRV